MAKYAIFHASKGTSTGAGLGNHIDRVVGKEHTYKHADSARKHLNVDYSPAKFKSKPLHECVKERIKEGYQGKKAIRKDAVKYITCVFTASPDGMNEILNAKRLKEWVKANADFAIKEFGTSNIVRFVLHLDEKTPHLHCVFVPLTKDGRLSGKEIMGNKTGLSERQDRYAESMLPFGLERGIKGSRAIHDSVTEYQTRVNKGLAQKPIKDININLNVRNIQITELPPLFNREEWLKTQNKAISEHFLKINDELSIQFQNAFKTQENGIFNQYLAVNETNERLKRNKDQNLREREGKVAHKINLLQQNEREIEKSRGQKIK